MGSKDVTRVRREGRSLFIEGIFGTHWRFFETIEGRALGIDAWKKGKTPGVDKSDVNVGLGVEQTLALRDYLVEKFGPGEGYVKDEPEPEPERVRRFKPGDRVRVKASLLSGRRQTETARVLPDETVTFDYWVRFDSDGYNMAVRDSELEPYEPDNQEVRDELPDGAVIRFNSEKATWYKAGGEWWASSSPGLKMARGTFTNPANWSQRVEFDPRKGR